MKSYLDKYIKIIVAVYVLFENGEDILLIKRENTGYCDGFYSLPAGHLDGNEAATQAAKREVKEEVGLNILSEDLELIYTLHRISPHPVIHERVDLYFRLKKWKGQPKNAEPQKHSEIKWFPATKLPNNMVPEVKKAITDILSGKNYGEFGFS